MENESYVELRKKEGISTRAKTVEKEGCAVMVKNALNRIGAFLNSIANAFSSKNGSVKLRGRAGGGPPAKSGEGPRGLRHGRLRVLVFLATFFYCFCFGEGPKLNALVASAFIAAWLSTLDLAVTTIKTCIRFCVNSFERLCSWCVHHELKAFTLGCVALAPLYVYDIALGKVCMTDALVALPMLALVSATLTLVLPRLFVSETSGKYKLYVASSDDGLEAWLQTYDSGNARRVVEIVAPQAAFTPMPKPDFSLFELAEEIERLPPSVIIAVMQRDEEFKGKVDRLYHITMDGCGGELFRKLDKVYQLIEYQKYVEECRELGDDFEGEF